MKRSISLDILRGLSAFAIMFYHISGWINHGIAHSSDTFLGRIGLYGVSIFYVLSGLTMSLVYKDTLNSFVAIKAFYIKRVLRIYPLYWLAVMLSVALLKTEASLLDLFFNFTGLFAILSTKSLTTGGWSIGNELIFYLFFPILMYCLFSQKIWFWFILLLSCIAGLYFGFFILHPQVDMVIQWDNYVNVFNQLYFFIAGIALLTLTHLEVFLKKNPFINMIGLLVLCGIFLYYPTNGPQTVLIAGVNKVIFSTMAIGICFCFYMLEINQESFVTVFLSKLGEISYGIYLIHPICFFAVRKLLAIVGVQSSTIVFTSSILLTIGSSYLIYSILEKPAINLGKRVANHS